MLLRSLPIHDLERAHGVPVRVGGLESGAHRAYENDPVYLGGAPYPDGRRDLPQLGVGAVNRVI